MKRLLVYIVRWQLSTPVLALITCLTIDRIGSIGSAIIANLIGALIFYKIDKNIFGKKQNNKK